MPMLWDPSRTQAGETSPIRLHIRVPNRMIPSSCGFGATMNTCCQSSPSFSTNAPSRHTNATVRYEDASAKVPSSYCAVVPDDITIASIASTMSSKTDSSDIASVGNSSLDSANTTRNGVRELRSRVRANRSSFPPFEAMAPIDTALRRQYRIHQEKEQALASPMSFIKGQNMSKNVFQPTRTGSQSRSRAMQVRHVNNWKSSSSLHRMYANLDTLRDLVPRNHPSIAKTWNLIGKHLFDKKEYEEALKSYRQAIECEPCRSVVDAYKNMAELHWALARVGQSIECYWNALRVLEYCVVIEGDSPKESLGMAWLFHRLGLSYVISRSFDLAMDSFRKAKAIRERVLGATSDEVSEISEAMALTRRMQAAGDMTMVPTQELKLAQTKLQTGCYLKVPRRNAVPQTRRTLSYTAPMRRY